MVFKIPWAHALLHENERVTIFHFSQVKAIYKWKIQVITNIYDLPTKAFRNRATMNVKIAEPITAHIIGNGFPSMVISKKCGSPIFPATHSPI